MYREWRHREWPAESGYSLDQQQKRNAYHQARRETRGHEALTPAQDTRIPILDVRDGERSGTRSEPIGAFQQPVYDPDADGGDGAVVYTEPTRWAPGQFTIIPKFSVRTTSLSSSEHAVLHALWDLKDPYEWSVNVKAVVRGRNQEEIGNGSGLSHNRVSEVTSSLEEKGFLTKKADGFGEPCRYFLTQTDHGHWTYASLDRGSARVRIQRLLGKDADEIDWSQVGSIDLWQQRRRREAEKKDEAQRKLERDHRRGDARRKRHEDGEQKSMGEAVAGALTSWEGFKAYMNASPEERHEHWKERKNAPPDD